jgi:erythromycin esterase-like protein
MIAQTQSEMGSVRASRATNDALVVGFAMRTGETVCSCFANGWLILQSVRREGASNHSRGRLRSPII